MKNLAVETQSLVINQVAEQNVFTLYSMYLHEPKSAKLNTKTTSVLVRYLVPVMGGPVPKGVRATPDEIKSALDFLQQYPPSFLLEAPQLLDQVLEEKGVDKDSKRSFRSTIRMFLNWAIAKGYLQTPEKEPEDPKEQIQYIQFRVPNGQGIRRTNNHHGGSNKEPWALMAKKRGGELAYPGDYINEHLKLELKEFEKFRQERYNCAKRTIEIELRSIYQVLGWLNRYKKIPLDQLRLTTIVSFCQLNVSWKECLDKNNHLDFNQHFLQKAMAREMAIKEATETKNLILEYINFIGGTPRNKGRIVKSAIALAKFIFKDEVGTDDYPDELEIPVIRRLNQLSQILDKQQKTTSPTIPYHQKSVPWENVRQVLEKLRIRANTHVTRISQQGGRYVYSAQRRQNGILDDLQNFLSLGFMTIMPPDRSRTYYELEIDKTLVQGIYQRGLFIPKPKMDNPSQALWYIHLEPGSYKTGKVYGEWWGEVPNVRFSDGTTFYEYIDKWLTEGREFEQKCDHNFFFRGSHTYKPLRSEDWRQRIKHIFVRETGKPVTAKELRKMYVTYLKDSGASEAELEAAAYAMHHSRRMQSQVYDKQDGMNKMAPISKLNEREWEKGLSGN